MRIVNLHYYYLVQILIHTVPPRVQAPNLYHTPPLPGNGHELLLATLPQAGVVELRLHHTFWAGFTWRGLYGAW